MNSLSFIGSHLLSLSLPVTLFSCVMYLVGAKRSNAAIVLAAQRANLLSFLLLTAAALLLIFAFVTNDYSILYVYNYSDRSLPLFYKITGLWAGLDGSILLWIWLVSLYAMIVLYQNRKKNSDWMPYINAVLMLIIIFFLSLVLFANNPFTPLNQEVVDGKGLNPLLQNIAMVIHPPSLYLGFTGFAVPFAFVIAALITRKLDSTWIEATRRWTIIAWFFLTLGNILGGAWAYVELGWGGFWAWDPVENAAIIPWFTATAYLHSVIIQKRRGMLMVWNVSLVCITFLLTIFATFLTRSGVVESVHAFSDGRLGPFFMAFMILIVVVSFYLIKTRLPNLKSNNMLTSYLSKESAFLFNNVILIVCAFAIIWGTLFPAFSEYFTGQRITVGPSFFNKMMAPMGLILIFLMGVGPMISWKKVSPKKLKLNLGLPMAFGIVAGIVGFIFGFKQWYVLTSIILIGFVLATIYLEFYRGVRAVRIQKKLPFFSSFIDLIMHSNRRFGGYIVHLGILLIFVGIAGTVYKQEADFSLNPGQSFVFDDYRFVYVKPHMAESQHKVDLRALVDVYRGDKKVDQLSPAKYFYKSSEQPSTEAAIYQRLFEDVYLIIGNINPQTKRADFRVTINPLVIFLWIGGIVILFGTIIILLPRGFRIRSGLGKASLLLVGILLGGFLAVNPVRAQSDPAAEQEHEHEKEFVHKETGEKPFQVQTDDPLVLRQKNISSKLICMCGGCVRNSLRTCTCGFAVKERGIIMSMLKEGLSGDNIVQSFVQKYGLRVLGEPPREGFFNVGYWMPGIVLFLAFLGGGWMVRSWYRSRRETPVSPEGERKAEKEVSKDSSYAKKLESELEHYDE